MSSSRSSCSEWGGRDTPALPVTAWGIGRCGRELSEEFSSMPGRGMEEQDMIGAVPLLSLCVPLGPWAGAATSRMCSNLPVWC